MKIQEELVNLRAMNNKELQDNLLVLLKSQFDMRMQHSATQLSDISKLNKIKKSIARVKTLIRANTENNNE